MERLIAKEVAGLKFNVRRLTMREVYRLFDPPPEGAAAREPDLPGDYLFADLTIHDLLELTEGLSREQLLDLTPHAVEGIIAEIKRENPHFFGGLQRIREHGARVAALLLRQREGSPPSVAPSSA